MMDMVLFETSTLLPVFVFPFSHIWLFSTSPKCLLIAEVTTQLSLGPKIHICVQNDQKTGGEHSDVLWRSLSSLKGWGRESIRGNSSCVLCLCFQNVCISLCTFKCQHAVYDLNQCFGCSMCQQDESVCRTPTQQFEPRTIF